MSFISSRFFKNVLVLFSGNFLFQLITILSLILISRYYSPEIVGEYAVFLSINTIICTFATGRLEMALMLPDNEEETKNIFLSSFFLVVLIVLLTSLFFLILFLCGAIGDKLYLIYILPITIFLSSLSLLNIQYLNRKEKFKTVSIGKVMSAALTAIIQLGSIVLYKNVIIIILAYPLGLLLTNGYYLLKLNEKFNFLSVKFISIKNTLIKYKNFPFTSNISSLFNMFANQGPVILIEIVFGSAISGFYSIVQKTLNAPTSLIGMAFSQVFYKKITSEVSFEETKKLMVDSSKYFILLTIPILLVVLFFSEYLYTTVFGEKYIISAEIAKTMILFFLVRLVIVSQNSLLIARGKLKLDLKFNIAYAFSVLSPIFLASYIGYGWNTTIILMTILGTSYFIILGYYLFSDGKNKN